ncbi:MAG: sigma factor [Candidatus Kaistia colombiensis]|nr:MAG: sigma factor [Kaistia sp.]
MATQRIEHAVRESYGRLIAILSTRDRDIAAAEDSLADAIVAALEQWPEQGIPDQPEAWLVAVARRRLIDRARRNATGAALARSLALLSEISEEPDPAAPRYPDERLRLLFVCAHPAIDPAVHAPLMLQTVLGLSAARIAAAFIVSPDAMARRLTRAKLKIRDAGIGFELPDARELADRLEPVLDAIYAAYGSGWDGLTGDSRRDDLATEAIWLGRTLNELLPAQPEALGLLALMLHLEARRPARRARDGAYVPLSDQDTGLWSRGLLAEAEATLRRAATFGKTGRYQLEAAIQSAHAGHRLIGEPDKATIVALYDSLFRRSPRLGVAVGRAAATAEADGAEAGLRLLAAIDADRVAQYQPFWAVRADLLARTGGADALGDAILAYDRAIALAEDPAIRQHLSERRARLLS